MHVTHLRASHRTLACLQGNGGLECSHHKEARWWEKYKNAIADAIKGQLEIKRRLKMSTPFDDRLKMCRLCGCCMELKVWCDIKHIADHTTEQKLAEYPRWCWQAKEIKELQNV